MLSILSEQASAEEQKLQLQQTPDLRGRANVPRLQNKTLLPWLNPVKWQHNLAAEHPVDRLEAKRFDLIKDLSCAEPLTATHQSALSCRRFAALQTTSSTQG